MGDLVERLELWLKHSGGCESYRYSHSGHQYPCNCGLADELDAIQASQAREGRAVEALSRATLREGHARAAAAASERGYTLDKRIAEAAEDPASLAKRLLEKLPVYDPLWPDDFRHMWTSWADQFWVWAHQSRATESLCVSQEANPLSLLDQQLAASVSEPCGGDLSAQSQPCAETGTHIPSSPVAWRVKDFADGWILCNTLEAAEWQAKPAGNLIEPLFTQTPQVSPPLREAIPPLPALPDQQRGASVDAPSHTDLMVSPESLDWYMRRDTAMRTICDFMGWPEDGPAWADAQRLAESLGFGPPPLAQTVTP